MDLLSMYFNTLLLVNYRKALPAAKEKFSLDWKEMNCTARHKAKTAKSQHENLNWILFPLLYWSIKDRNTKEKSTSLVPKENKCPLIWSSTISTAVHFTLHLHLSTDFIRMLYAAASSITAWLQLHCSTKSPNFTHYMTVHQLHGKKLKTTCRRAVQKRKPTQNQRVATEQTFPLSLIVSPFQPISFPSVSYYDTCDGLRT